MARAAGSGLSAVDPEPQSDEERRIPIKKARFLALIAVDVLAAPGRHCFHIPFRIQEASHYPSPCQPVHERALQDPDPSLVWRSPTVALPSSSPGVVVLLLGLSGLGTPAPCLRFGMGDLSLFVPVAGSDGYQPLG